ncbi:MAG: DUF3892 domain-containing protein [Defluviitaleaceae bacterium]|nr:DUF3892 domain-containing protein [Defluviitaleaceae bacterium]
MNNKTAQPYQNHGISSGLESLPMNAFSEIPTPSSDAMTITALRKDDGRVTGYQLSNGQILDKEDAVALARKGGIAGVGIATRDGSEYLKSLPDDSENNNLSHLPSITQEGGDIS